MLERRAFLLGAPLALSPVLARAAPQKPPAIAQDVALLGAPDAVLEAKIAALAGEAGLHVGFAAVDLGKGRTAFVRGGELFPMQSVYKLPIAIAALRMAQDGTLALQRKVRLTAGDIAPGRSPLAARLRGRPTQFTVQQLIEHMLLNSDNTATDAVMRVAGGPDKIQAVIKTFDIDGLRVDRYERDLQPQALGLEPDPAYSDFAKLKAALDALGEVKQKEALERYLRDRRDTASPRALATLLFKLLSSHLIQPRFVTLVLDLMRRTKTGEDRLRAGMLPAWTFAHRGGTSLAIQGRTAAFNDVGVATNKSGAKIAIVLLISDATLAGDELARFHRAAARAVLQEWA
jgi:beta-lactamase class A